MIEESNALQNVNAETVQNLKFTWLTVPEVTKDPFVDSTWARVPEVIKDPLACSSFRNLLLFFPGMVFLRCLLLTVNLVMLLHVAVFIQYYHIYSSWCNFLVCFKLMHFK